MSNAGFVGFISLLVLSVAVLFIPDFTSGWHGTDDGLLIAWAILISTAFMVAK